MRNYHRFIFFFFALGFLSSCEDVVDFPGEERQQLVVFSNFSDQNGLEVLVYKTKSVLSNTATEFVNDAEVSVYADDELLEVLEFVPSVDGKSPPFFRTQNLQPEVAKLYTIKVAALGFETITATNSIPKAVPIDSVYFDNTVDENADSESEIKFNVAVTLRDPADVDNFYHLKFYQEFTPYVIGTNGDTIKGATSLSPPLEIHPLDLNSPVFKYELDQSFLLDDTQFNGSSVTLSFKGNYRFNPRKQLVGKFLVELRTVSEAYYLYHYTLSKQKQDSGPLSDGVVIYNNIENGVGNFSGFASAFNASKLGN